MNKITTTLIGILAIMFFTGNVYAGNFGSTTSGADLTVTGTNSGDLVFTPSPGMLMGGETSDTAFTIVAGNTKSQDNAVVICMTNATPTVYQIGQDLTNIDTGVALTGADAAAGASDSTFKARN